MSPRSARAEQGHPVADGRIVGDAALKARLAGSVVADLAENVELGGENTSLAVAGRRREARYDADDEGRRRANRRKAADGQPPALGNRRGGAIEFGDRLRSGNRDDASEVRLAELFHYSPMRPLAIGVEPDEARSARMRGSAMVPTNW